MASQRHLKDLLEEDQEPFQLQSYISDRRCQIKKRKPVSQNAFPSRFCRNASFFSSPDPKKSPLFEPKSPKRSQNAIFVNIPARTAAILLEAAVRIQKQEVSKTKRRNAGNAFGLFGSVLKKLTHRKKQEISGESGRVSSVKNMLRWESPVVRKIITKKSKRKDEEKEEVYSKPQKIASETQFSRRSSSSGDVDFETSNSSSSQSSGSNHTDEFLGESINGSDLSESKRFCESPFHFVLQTMPSSGGFKTPNFTSPATSPPHEIKKESYEVDQKLKKLEMEEEEEEEEDKEQSSPVSVLDPPFQDDDEDIHMDDDINISSSFRSLQKAKHLLLQKLCRFEQLAGLDHMELEEDEEEEEDEMKNLYHCEIITQRVLKTYFEAMDEVPEGIEALIADLVAEELQCNDDVSLETEMVEERVCKRLSSWRDVVPNTIDMMVEHDFRTESLGKWRSKNETEVAETVFDIEFRIFEDLVEELSSGGFVLG